MSRKIVNPKPITDVSALAYFNFAREYHRAANHLFDLGQRGSLMNPTNFLYFHTVELALKAFLRSFNLPILGTRRAKGHSLTRLYEECRTLGLVIGPADQVEIANIVNLLQAGNKHEGFRYFNLESGSMASLSWTREVVEQLMRAVETHVGARSQQDTKPGGLRKVMIMYGKPEKAR